MEELKPSAPNTCPCTPLTFLERAATVYGNNTSIIYKDATYTWSSTHRRCMELASSLVSIIGIQRGQVVSVIAPNVPAMYELHFSVPMSGAILNTINTRLDARTVSILLCHSESKLLFVYESLTPLVGEALSLFPWDTKPPLLVLVNDKQASETEKTAVAANAKNVTFFDTYEGLIERSRLNKLDESFKWIRPKSEWDPIALTYTSGTTYSPKGVVHCHRGAFIMSLASLLDWSVPKQPVFLWILPMFHSNGWSFTWGMAAVGGVNVCVDWFDGPAIYRLIEKHSVTHMCAAPVVLHMIANTALGGDNIKRFSHTVNVMTGGAPPPAPVLLRMESLGFEVSHGYGLTETGTVAVTCAWKPEWNKFAATERARLKARQGVRTIGMTEVDVLDLNGNSVKRDGMTQGEIVLKGGFIMLGYLKNPTATAKCLTKDGWFYTGDVGVMHPDGYLEIKDRSKDVIISGGENISSVEVESMLYSCVLVNEVAVVARPDEFWGETPCAFVSLRKKTNDSADSEQFNGSLPVEKEIIEYCRARLPHYMVPKTVVIKDELPKTSTGKIQKFVLREIARSMGSTRASRM